VSVEREKRGFLGMQWIARLRQWLIREKGATMVEYAVLAAIMVVGLFTVLGSLRDEIQGMFTETANVIKCGDTTC